MLDEMKRALDAGRPIGIALLMGAEDKAEAIGEGGHLGRRHHPRAGAGGDDDVRVINHARRGRAAQVLQRVGQKDLAVKPREGRVGLEEEHARVAQDDGRRLDPLLDARERRPVGRRVVLHLLRGLKIVVAHGRRWLEPDAVAPAKRCQRRVGDRDALRDELLVDAHQIAATAIDPFENLIAVRLGLLGALNSRHAGAARLEDRPDRSPGDLQGARNLADPVALRP